MAPAAFRGCGCPVDTSAEGRSTDRAGRRDSGDIDACYIHTTQTYSDFDVPQKYEFKMPNTDFTQEDAFNAAKAVFGEKTAEYMIYHQYENQYNDETSNSMNRKLKTPDGKCSYTYTRQAGRYSGKTSLRLEVEFYETYTSNNFSNGYKPMERAVPLTDMIGTDMGGTDYLKPESFFDKALAYGSEYDPYTRSTVDTERLEQITFSDGSVMASFTIKGHRISEPMEKTKLQGSKKGTLGEQRGMGEREFNVSSVLTLNSDKSIDVHSFSMKLPSVNYITVEFDPSFVDECLDTAKKQAAELLKLDSKDLEDGRESVDDDTSNDGRKELDKNYRVSSAAFKVFGKEFKTKLAFFSKGDMFWGGTSDQETTYHSHVQIGDSW